MTRGMRSFFGFARMLICRCSLVLIYMAQHAGAQDATYLSSADIARVKPIYALAAGGDFAAAERAARDAKLPVMADIAQWMKYRSPGAFRTESDVNDAVKRFRHWPDFSTIQARIESSENKLDPSVYAALFSSLSPVTPAGRIIAYRINQAAGRG